MPAPKARRQAPAKTAAYRAPELVDLIRSVGKKAGYSSRQDAKLEKPDLDV
jgi:hypothetical protein